MQPHRWQQVKQTFEEVTSKPESEREAYLNETCANDSALRREVESLLSSFSHSGNFLEPPSPLTEEHSNHYVGKHVGTYRIEKLISYGGMGAVYEAVRDDGQFWKKVAVKLVRPVAFSDELIKRFHQEREMLARLEHPNIASLLDGGTTEDGIPYLVMEFVDGIPIDEYCNSKKLSIAERLALFRSVCSAVQYAHQNLVVHRDIKSGNILVTESGTPKLLDFGIAKFLNEVQQAEPSDTTRAGLRFITLEYASPEQIKGEALSTASDVYSLGILLYKLLTGRSPYQLKSHLPHEITRAVCEQEPLKPSTNPIKTSPPSSATNREQVSLQRGVTPAKLRRQLSGDLDNILLKSLQKDPSRRYASVEQFSEDIRRHCEGMPVLARPDTIRYRTEKFIARHTIGFATTIILVLALVGGIAGILWQSRVAQREAERATRINGFLLRMLGSVNPSAEGRDVTITEALDRVAMRVRDELGDDPDMEASVRKTLGTTYHGLGHYEKARSQLATAVEIFAMPAWRSDKELASALHELGSVEQSAGNSAAAESLYTLSISLYRSLGATMPNTELAQALNDFGTLRGEADNDYVGAERLFHEALAMYDRALGKEHPKIAEAMLNLAVALQSQKRLAEAESVYALGLGMIRRLRGENHMDYATALSNYAELLADSGATKEAEQTIRTSLAIHERLLSRQHPDVAFTRLSLAKILIVEGQSIEGLKLLGMAEDVWKQSLPNDHPYTLDLMLWKAKALNRQKKYAASSEILIRLINQLRGRDNLSHRLSAAERELQIAGQGLDRTRPR